MGIVTFAIVVIAALFAIGSGIWVATALVRAISGNRTAQTKCQPVESLPVESLSSSPSLRAEGKVERKAERQPQSDANGPD